LPLSDPLREDVASVVAGLRERGLEVAIVSGDRTEAVADVARRCDIASWSAEQRPQDKLARIEDLKKSGHRVLMVGDGLNDAPALAAGHASLSPSTATDVSQTAADAIFQGHRLAPVLDAIDVGRAAQRHAKENFAIAIAYNMVFVPMAVVGWVTPLIAAIAMSASSIAVTANALRLGLAGRNRSVR
jgi:Cu2+-exporting ATPase